MASVRGLLNDLLKCYLADLLFGIIILIIGVIISTLPPYVRFFVERDPTLSYPYKAQESVPVWLLIVLSYVIPTIVIILTQVLVRTTRQYSIKIIEHPQTTYSEYWVLPHLAMAQSVGYTFFLTTILKIFAGRLRPNFFAMCNYHGYRDALATGNFTSYNSLTVAGVIGSINNCLEPNISLIYESEFSFPSGHASTAFAGLLFFALYLIHVAPDRFWIDKQTNFRFFPIKMTLLLILFLGASFISVSRTRDYWHNFDDILGGAILGFGVAFCSFWMNYKELEMENEVRKGDV